MPRLGGNDVRSSSPRRNFARSYSRILPKYNLRNVLVFLVAFFFVRNILKSDYRKKQMDYLKESGMTDEEIEQIIPKTLEERKKYAADKANDINRMKKDIAYLLQEVSNLKSLVKNSGGKGGRDAGLLEMDHLHKEKRKRREEQLLKDHPDFKASPRIDRDNQGDTTTV